MREFTAVLFSCSDEAMKYGESNMTLTGDLMRFTIPVNMAGLPAISIPIAQSASGDLVLDI